MVLLRGIVGRMQEFERSSQTYSKLPSMISLLASTVFSGRVQMLLLRTPTLNGSIATRITEQALLGHACMASCTSGHQKMRGPRRLWFGLAVTKMCTNVSCRTPRQSSEVKIRVDKA